jgi:hypothetical protein
MIRRCTDGDVATIDAIVNQAAAVYRGVIPDECWHEPYMSRTELLAELTAGVEFWGCEEGGAALLTTLTEQASRPLLIGTWADAQWAIRFYRKHGFELAEKEETPRLLDTYWRIAPRQRDASVVLTQRLA